MGGISRAGKSWNGCNSMILVCVLGQCFVDLALSLSWKKVTLIKHTGNEQAGKGLARKDTLTRYCKHPPNAILHHGKQTQEWPNTTLLACLSSILEERWDIKAKVNKWHTFHEKQELCYWLLSICMHWSLGEQSRVRLEWSGLLWGSGWYQLGLERWVRQVREEENIGWDPWPGSRESNPDKGKVQVQPCPLTFWRNWALVIFVPGAPAPHAPP